MGLPAKPDNILYHTIVPQGDVFEEHCFECAHGGHRIHYYQQVKDMNMWIDVVMTPVAGQGRTRGGFGVVYADLNGLKTANDTQGHEAGDRLIVTAVEVLREAFAGDEVYRAGGDEFVVITTATQDSFDRQVARLHEILAARDDISCSVGYCYRADGEQLERTIERADAMMYEEKWRYYSRKGNGRRAGDRRE